MTERELFDAIGRLPEHYRTEALALEQPCTEQKNEIDALFDSASHTEAVQYRKAPEPEKPVNRPVAVLRKTVPQKPQKSGILGLTAIAAAVALTVGVFAWKMRQDSEMQGNSAAMPGSSADYVQQSDIPAETVTMLPEEQSGSSTQTTGQTDGIPLPEDVPDADEMFTPSPDPTGKNGGVNTMGGHGLLKTVSNTPGTLILEDDDNWYINGGTRISKTVHNANGHLYGELLCQKPGCAHQLDDCPYFNCHNRLLSDGKNLYMTGAKLDGVPNLDQTLFKQDESGIFEPFFSPDLYKRVITSFKQNNQLTEISYAYVLQLGDTDTFYIALRATFYNAANTANEVRLFGVLLDKKSDRFAITLYSDGKPLYDAEHELLYLFESDGNYYPRYYNACIYDMKQIALSYDPEQDVTEPAEMISVFHAYTLLDGKLYYYNDCTDAAYRLLPGECSLYCYDPEKDRDHAVMLLEEKTNRMDITAADGRLYYRTHASVGKDKICSCAPDLTDEQVVYETPQVIRNLYPIEDPAFIHIDAEASIFLLDGTEEKIDASFYD
ncbi:MAG: hypothetical protein IKH27_06010 [Oscillospiraceae bacterium]|nr:hypothetical protein [Oscillospiraceae bacterium]